MVPTIAIPELGPGLLRMYLGSQYVFALRAAGAKVRWIRRKDPQAVLSCDGLLIPGGDDIDPKLYGAEKKPECGKQNPIRDQLDPEVMEMFLQTGKPMLGICRGMQMMNVFMGGTLHQDIKDIQQIPHGGYKRLKELHHPVRIEKGTLLRKIIGEDEISVNTFHHQAAQRLGQGLVISAAGSDGIVEAVELPTHRFFLGVQWHPEHLQRHESHEKIITAFVEACKN